MDELERLLQNGSQDCFYYPDRRWQKCIFCTRGLFWKKCSRNYCSVLYFSAM